VTDIPRGLGIRLRRLVQQGLGPVHQPPVWRPQGLDEGVDGVVLPPVPTEIDVEAVEGVVSLPGLELQILPPTGKAREDGGQGKHEHGRKQEKKPRNLAENLTWKTRHAEPLWIRNASFNARG
jgi:hypothetical protein